MCKQLSELLAHPISNDGVWGTLTIVENGVPALEWLMYMIPWLVQRAAGALLLHHDKIAKSFALCMLSLLANPFASPSPPQAVERDFLLYRDPGIRTIVLRPPPGAAVTWNWTLHTMMFTLAGAFQSTHVKLEVRQHAALKDMQSCHFMADFRAPCVLNMRSGVQSLAATLTALEVRWRLHSTMQWQQGGGCTCRAASRAACLQGVSHQMPVDHCPTALRLCRADAI